MFDRKRWTREWLRTERARRKALGLCTVCRAPVQRFTKCVACRAVSAAAEARRAQLRRAR